MFDNAEEAIHDIGYGYYAAKVGFRLHGDAIYSLPDQLGHPEA